MNTPCLNRYKHHRFPVEIISHAVWLYFRFCLSYRDVEGLLFARGVIGSVRTRATSVRLMRRTTQTWFTRPSLCPSTW